jgi:hypothetical protein
LWRPDPDRCSDRTARVSHTDGVRVRHSGAFAFSLHQFKPDATRGVTHLYPDGQPDGDRDPDYVPNRVCDRGQANALASREWQHQEVRRRPKAVSAVER